MSKEAKYFLPFDTSKNPIRISQGKNGPWSHFLQRREAPTVPGHFLETDLVHAVDFALPLGTPVLVAREGQVKNLYHGSDWFYEGLDPEIGNNPPFMSTNYAVVEHSDGTRAWYAHLSTEVLVQRNQIVNVGDIIARTGKSGWIAEIPHLHFMVVEERANNKSPTIPVTFENYSGSLDHATLEREGQIWFGK